MPLSRLYFLAAAVAGLSSVSAASPAPPPPSTLPAPPPADVPSISATRVSRAPTFDGRLDDPLWQTAPSITAFRQVQPHLHAASSEPTDVRILYDRDNLYIGIRCTEGTDEILGSDMGHDSYDSTLSQGATFSSDDYVAITIDAFGRRQEGYYFAVNPAGAWADGLVYNGETLDLNWDTVWYNRAHRDATGWTVQIVIPFKSIAFAPGLGTWGINVERMIRRKQELARWTAVNRGRQMYSLSKLGEIEGIADIRQGIGLDFEPYARFRHTQGSPAGPASDSFKGGGELVWHVLPSLDAILTVNTDFAEAEVDSRQVNLTRFPLFYPEKRDFFLRDGSFFTFGGLASVNSLVPYYSRRIGLAADGTPANLPIGVKIAGRAGPLTVGIFDTVVDANGAVPQKNLGVARIACQVSDDSSVGVLVTNGDPRGPGQNTLFGADYNWVNDTLIDGKTIYAHAWVLGTRSDAAGGRGMASEVRFKYPNDPVHWEIALRAIDKKFDPALGFVNLAGVRLYHVVSGYSWHPNGAVVRDIDIGEDSDLSTNFRNRDVKEDADVLKFVLTGSHGDTLAPLWITDRADRPLTPFTVAPGVVIPPGFYRWLVDKVQLTTTANRPLSGLVSVLGGNYYNGTQLEETASAIWRPDSHWSLTGSCDLYQIKLPEGHFNVRILSGSLGYAWTPYLSARILYQYDTQSRLLGEDYRVQWTVFPGDTVFLVLDRGYFNDPNSGWAFRSGQDTLKAGWTWKF